MDILIGRLRRNKAKPEREDLPLKKQIRRCLISDAVQSSFLTANVVMFSKLFATHYSLRRYFLLEPYNHKYPFSDLIFPAPSIVDFSHRMVLPLNYLSV
jgi:hypothetical protein